MQSKDVPEQISKFYQPGFKLHLYCAFASRQEAIGLDLIESLEKICQAKGLDNFKATVRLSKTDDGSPALPRWEPDYINKELGVYAGQLAKVWVCGPPALNQSFDQTLGKSMERLQLSRH